MATDLNTTNPSKFNKNGNFLHIDAEDIDYRQQWLDKYPNEVAEFSKMSLVNLGTMFKALTCSLDGAGGYFRNPKDRFTPAQDWLTGYSDNIDGIRQALVFHAEQRDIVTKDDYTNLCNIKFKYLVLCEGSPEEFILLSVKLLEIEPKKLAKAA